MDGATVLALSGELDLAGAPAPESALAAARAARTVLNVDLSELELIDSSGLDRVLPFVASSEQPRARPVFADR